MTLSLLVPVLQSNRRNSPGDGMGDHVNHFDDIGIRHQDFHPNSASPHGTVHGSGSLFAVANIYAGILLRESLLPVDGKGTTA